MVEVIVALAILSIGMSTLIAVISTSLQQTAAAARTTEAGSLAQSLLARLGTELPIATGEQTGEFANGVRWTLSTTPYGDVRERQEWPVGAFHVSAEVEWVERGQRRTYVLDTLRLGPKGGMP